MTILFRYASLASLALATFSPAAEKTPAQAKESEHRLKRDLAYLASDELEGRGPNTKGLDKAADYIAAEFKKLGLKPAGPGGSYFQGFTIPGARLTQPATLTFAGPDELAIEGKAGVDFHPMGLSHTGATREAGMVFVGYGIVHEKFDEYKGVDVAGKVVVALSSAPEFHGLRRSKHASFTEKMLAAEKRDALAVVFVHDADNSKDGDELIDFNWSAASRSPAKIPAVHVKRVVMDRILNAAKLEFLRDLQKEIDAEKEPRSVAIKGWSASLDVRVKRDTFDLRNVIGVLEGKGPLADETVVIGAHYDHLGHGGASSLSPLRRMAIHNGADDNASGTAGMMELAHRFAAIKGREGRRMVFMAFSGEEMGLLGSAYYCKNPLFPHKETAAMINLDMIGRAVPHEESKKDKLQVWGTGTAKTFDPLIEELNKKYDFHLRKVAGGMGPSDQASFYERKVPVFFFFTGDHSDYHRPSDDYDKINYPSLRKVVDLTEEIASRLASDAKKPEYVEVKGTTTVRPGGGPRLGIRPAYGDDKEGVLVEGVAKDAPADKAGVQADDRIIGLAGEPVKNITQYMELMAKQKAGTTIELTVKRKDKELKLKAKLE